MRYELEKKTIIKLSSAISGILALAILIPIVMNGSNRASTSSRDLAAVHYKSVNAKVQVSSPSEGDCWRSNDFQADYKASYYISGKNVPCNQLHDSVTFSVQALPANTHMTYQPGLELTGFPSSRVVLDEVTKNCKQAFQSRYSTDASRLSWMWFLPDPFAWAAGARWLRCDVFTIKWGSHIGSESGALVSSSLAEIDQHFAAHDYEICMKTGSSGSPFASDATYANCNGGWDMKLIAQENLTPMFGATYPGESQVQNEAAYFCGGQTPNPIPDYYYPNEYGWSTGTTSVTCWERG